MASRTERVLVASAFVIYLAVAILLSRTMYSWDDETAQPGAGAFASLPVSRNRRLGSTATAVDLSWGTVKSFYRQQGLAARRQQGLAARR